MEHLHALDEVKEADGPILALCTIGGKAPTSPESAERLARKCRTEAGRYCFTFGGLSHGLLAFDIDCRLCDDTCKAAVEGTLISLLLLTLGIVRNIKPELIVCKAPAPPDKLALHIYSRLPLTFGAHKMFEFLLKQNLGAARLSPDKKWTPLACIVGDSFEDVFDVAILRRRQGLRPIGAAKTPSSPRPYQFIGVYTPIGVSTDMPPDIDSLASLYAPFSACLSASDIAAPYLEDVTISPSRTAMFSKKNEDGLTLPLACDMITPSSSKATKAVSVSPKWAQLLQAVATFRPFLPPGVARLPVEEATLHQASDRTYVNFPKSFKHCVGKGGPHRSNCMKLTVSDFGVELGCHSTKVHRLIFPSIVPLSTFVPFPYAELKN
jgi:hypothetical protein